MNFVHDPLTQSRCRPIFPVTVRGIQDERQTWLWTDCTSFFHSRRILCNYTFLRQGRTEHNEGTYLVTEYDCYCVLIPSYPVRYQVEGKSERLSSHSVSLSVVTISYTHTFSLTKVIGPFLPYVYVYTRNFQLNVVRLLRSMINLWEHERKFWP